MLEKNEFDLQKKITVYKNLICYKDHNETLGNMMIFYMNLLKVFIYYNNKLKEIKKKQMKLKNLKLYYEIKNEIEQNFNKRNNTHKLVQIKQNERNILQIILGHNGKDNNRYKINFARIMLKLRF